MNFWLQVLEQFTPLAGLIWCGHRMQRQMKILSLELQRLTEAAARIAAKATEAKDVQALATNASTPNTIVHEADVAVADEEPQPLPIAVARYRNE